MKRYFTFIEMMIVLLIIGIIAGAISHNMSGGVKEAKRFEALQASRSLEAAIYYQLGNGQERQLVIDAIKGREWETLLQKLVLLNEEQRRSYASFLSSGDLECRYEDASGQVVVSSKKS
jgi:prepilin-type N-terminal cleavage/methylation domain-containing protein